MRKILFNREEPHSNEIRKNQDFDLVLKKYREAKLYWQSPWFYGAIGIASITCFLCVLGF
jgi:hypothetical protein